MTDVMCRPARPDEAGLLGELALRSKGHWGYDQAFLDACRAVLRYEPEQVLARRIVVAERGARILGFYSLDGEPPDGELGNLWVEPDAIGTGVGKRLWRHATEAATSIGFTRLTIEADPFAEPFYAAMGAVRIGEAPSEVVAGRMVPLMEYRLR